MILKIFQKVMQKQLMEIMVGGNKAPLGSFRYRLVGG